MKSKECRLIQELLVLYAENLVSQETTEYIEEHLAACSGCAREWETFAQPLPDPLPMEKMTPETRIENKLFIRLKKTAIAAVLIVVMSGAGLSFAAYTAGKHIGLDDPSYRFARELGLFSDIKQSKMIGGIGVNIDKGLFDSTRSVLLIEFSSPVKDDPQIVLMDDSGRQYEAKSSKGWQNKYFIFEFEALVLETQTVNVSLSLGDQTKDTAEFTIPVDMVKTAQYTKIIYPNQEKKLSNLKIILEKAVLGVSESQFIVRFDWLEDGTVSGIGIGRGTAYFPTSVTKAPDIPPPPGIGAPPPGGVMSGFAAAYGVNYRPEDPPANRPALYDLTGRQEAAVQGGEYKTTQFPCQVVATIKFAPVSQEAEQMELLLPPVYIYEKVVNPIKLQLNFQEKNELNLEKPITYQGGKVIIEKVWLEKNSVYLSYRLESSSNPEAALPHFELTDRQGMKQGDLRFDREKPQVIIFSLYGEEGKELSLNLDSMGQLIPREKFAIDLQEK